MRVILGGNLFIDCLALIAHRGVPMLSVGLEPLRLDLNPPLRPGSAAPELRHVTTDLSDAVFYGDHAVAIATLLDPSAGTVHISMDLRYIGLKIYVDVAGLHVGGNVFSGNRIEGAVAAINLSD